MERTEIFEKVNEVFRDVFDDESVTVEDKTTAADIENWNSLTHMTLISEIEDAFNIQFEMKEVLSMKNVGDMVDNILNMISGK